MERFPPEEFMFNPLLSLPSASTPAAPAGKNYFKGPEYNVHIFCGLFVDFMFSLRQSNSLGCIHSEQYIHDFCTWVTESW